MKYGCRKISHVRKIYEFEVLYKYETQFGPFAIVCLDDF